MLVLITMSISFPTGVILIIYMITHYSIPSAYHIQAMRLTIGLLLESIALALITPQVRELFKRNIHQVNAENDQTLRRGTTAQFTLNR